jgi:uncharacterized protein (TIGR02147 family)
VAAVVEGEAPDLFSFTDYREFLRRHYEFRRAAQPSFSYRFMATRLEIDPGQLAHILQGKLHLPQRALAATLKLCRFDARESAFFEELIRLGRCRKPEDAARSRERLDALRTVQQRELGPEGESFYHHWRHAVVRALASTAKVSDGGEFAGLCRPPLTSVEARESTELLEKIGLLSRDGDGTFRAREAHVVPGPAVSRNVLRKWHAQVLELAASSLEVFDAADRDVSTLTVAFSSKDLPTVRGWISDLRREVQARASATECPDRVLNACIQLFPVARTREAARSGPSDLPKP